jgi:hypothetical protein
LSPADLKLWVGWILGGLSLGVGIWNRLGKTGIRSLNIKTDGMMEYRSRADRAEATVIEKNDVRDRADKKELNGR